MQHTDRLKICQSCKNRQFKKKIGWVCSITNEVPDFEEICENKIEINIDYKRYNNIKHFDNHHKKMFFERYKRGIHFIIDNTLMYILMFNLSHILLYFKLGILLEMHAIVLYVFLYIVYFSLF